jgi:hypothetical protein
MLMTARPEAARVPSPAGRRNEQPESRGDSLIRSQRRRGRLDQGEVGQYLRQVAEERLCRRGRHLGLRPRVTHGYVRFDAFAARKQAGTKPT